MKKAARKKADKNVEEVVNEILEEVSENEVKDESKNKKLDNPIEYKKEESKEEDLLQDDVSLEDSKKKIDKLDSPSFYEKVMGEKPPETKVDIEEKRGWLIDVKLFLLGVFVFILTVLITSMAWLAILNKDTLLKGFFKKTVDTTPSISQTKQNSTPTPTPLVFVREEWQFEVLNGSNIPGLAAKGAEKIKALGYKVSKIGNADSSVDTAQVSLSKDATEVQKKAILEDLKKDFGDVNVTDSLPDMEKTVRLILVK